jgi:hypothetical protein
MPRFQIAVTALILALALPPAAQAQSTQATVPASPVAAQPSPRPPGAPKRDRVRWELGQDVYAGRRGGGLARYVGVSQGSNLVAFRAGVLDDVDSVPCSLGVTYQYTLRGGSPIRIKPSGSVSLARVFSCASTQDPQQGSSAVHGTATLSGGVRIAVLSGAHVAASMDVMAYVERRTGPAELATRNTKGMMVGIAIHRPLR